MEARNANGTDHLSGTAGRKPGPRHRKSGCARCLPQRLRRALQRDDSTERRVLGLHAGQFLKLSKPCLQALVDNKEATKADVDKYLEETRKGK
jgi:hypothetical protein